MCPAKDGTFIVPHISYVFIKYLVFFAIRLKSGSCRLIDATFVRVQTNSSKTYVYDLYTEKKLEKFP